MELDNLKQAWKALERRLERTNALQVQLLRERTVGRMRWVLAPLVGGQILQVLFGVAVIAGAAAFWIRHVHEPAMLATGVVLHVYGVAVVACGGITLGLVARIDHAAPVVEIQRRLAVLRRFYVASGLGVGLPWTFLWVLPLVMLARIAGHDLYVDAPGFVFGSIAVGVVLLGVALGLLRGLRDPRRAARAERAERRLSGGSLRRAQDALDEILRFEAE